MNHTIVKFLSTILITLLLVACGGGGDNASESGGGSAASTEAGPSFASCTEQQLYGTWRVTVSVGGLSETENATFGPEDEDAGKLQFDGNNFSLTEDGITLTGTINQACNSMSGTGRENASGLTGTWTAVKL